MKAHFTSAVVAAALLGWTVPALAHHPFAAEYDRTKPVHVTGSVSKIDWSNPHAMMIVEGKDQAGESAKWTFELGGPNALKRRGWSDKIVKAGDQVTVDGWMAKAGGHRANAKTLTLANGKELNAGSSYFDTSSKKAKSTH